MIVVRPDLVGGRRDDLGDDLGDEYDTPSRVRGWDKKRGGGGESPSAGSEGNMLDAPLIARPGGKSDVKKVTGATLPEGLTGEVK